MPMSYKVFAFFKRSQFSSVCVCPVEIPKICVCTAPLIPTVHKSELVALMLGEIALGGLLLTVVSLVLDEVTVLLLVDSVLIVLSSSAIARLPIIMNSNTANNEMFFMCLFSAWELCILFSQTIFIIYSRI